MKIWRCPICDDGHRAPARMRNVNALKYCLKCSAKTGKLVVRVCPSLDEGRKRREDARLTEEAKRKEKHAAKRTAFASTERGQLEAKCVEYLRLDAFKGLLPARMVMFNVRLRGQKKRVVTQLVRIENADGSVTYNEITTTKTYARPEMSTGRAWWGQGRFVVSAGSDRADAWATIIHEIAHIATPKDRGHGDQWRSVFADAIEEVTGERPSGDNKHRFHDSATACVRRMLDGGKVMDQDVLDTLRTGD